MVTSKYLIVGGSGFIGSNLVLDLIQKDKNEIVVFDNLKTGSLKFLNNIIKNKNLTIIIDDIVNWENYVDQLQDVTCLYHFAANADISKAEIDPTLDFYQGTLLTQHVAELARKLRINEIIYSSGSGVYGDHGHNELNESSTQYKPSSPYGANKLASEAILCAYSFMFNIKVRCFRFANVVGPNQTHGVGFDFLNKIKKNKEHLSILGNGTQSKSYIHVSDVISAFNFIRDNSIDNFYVANISTLDSLTVNEIANLVFQVCNIKSDEVEIVYSGGDKGWLGDVPHVRLNSSKIMELGWKPKLNSREAMLKALESMWDQLN